VQHRQHQAAGAEAGKPIVNRYPNPVVGGITS
jgi:hypothetical protein